MKNILRNPIKLQAWANPLLKHVQPNGEHLNSGASGGMKQYLPLVFFLDSSIILIEYDEPHACAFLVCVDAMAIGVVHCVFGIL